MERPTTRFQKRAAWRAVDAILQKAQLLDPGDPDARYDCVNNPKRYRYVEARHADLEFIAYYALRLRDAIGSLR